MPRSYLVSISPRLSQLCMVLVMFACTGCFQVPFRGGYAGPPERPEWIHEYYDTSMGYSTFTEKVTNEDQRYRVRRILIESELGQITIDYFQRRQKSDDLVLVFPILGGKDNIIANHFAEAFAFRGIDTAVVHRGKDFKDPENVDRLESIFRDTVRRDKLALDFFEKEYGKKDFGAFGISRGAINVAMTAGADPRLKYNVLALGGTSIVRLFAESDERRLRKYRESVQKTKAISGEQFIELLEKQIRTDPKYLADYLDARNTMMFLSLFDDTVPIKYGRRLRDQIGKPRTIYLLADHRTSVLYTQIVPIFPPTKCFGLFPIDYIETEAMHFFDEKFETGNASVKHFVFTIVQIPFMLAESLIALF